MLGSNLARSILICACFLLLSFSTKADDNELAVRVLDIDNNGIPSTVYVRSPLNKNERLKDTGQDGRLSVKYICGLGYTLWAMPHDMIRYFSSEPEDCESNITLVVIPKQTPVGAADEVIMKFPNYNTVNTKDNYAIVSKILIEAKTRTSPPISDPSLPQWNGEGCIADFYPIVFTQVFMRSDTGVFNKVTELESSSKNDKHLLADTATYNLPCNKVADLVNKTKIDKINEAKDYIYGIYGKTITFPPTADIGNLIKRYVQ